MDRPPLPVTDLDVRAWTALQWREEHLPLSRLRGVSDWQALTRLEQAAAGRIADRLGLDDDQRYSLISHHVTRVEQHGRPAGAPARSHGGRRLPRRGSRNVTVGWAVWFGNRRAGLRDRWFRLRTIRHYRGAPHL